MHTYRERRALIKRQTETGRKGIERETHTQTDGRTYLDQKKHTKDQHMYRTGLRQIQRQRQKARHGQMKDRYRQRTDTDKGQIQIKDRYR